MKEIAIECRSIVKNFGDPPVKVLRSISFVIRHGEFVAITGRSGSGKSTLLYAASGLDDLSGGNVLIYGKDIHSMKSEEMHHFRNTSMGFVFQFHYLLPELTALENVLMPARKFKLEKQKREKALSLIEQFELKHCLNKLPAQMSGGEQQRIAIARALIMDPDILFADEPTGNLDSANGEKVLGIFEKVNRENGTTILMVTHEKDFAQRGSRRIHLVDGEIFEDVKNRRK